ncbi:MAG: YfcC family protein [Fusobacteriaceae bacterium]|nr:YfcC family protein [Fusobacteriaceae bacterium]
MEKKKFQMPSSYTILFILIVIVAILTWIVPAGVYQYVDPEASKLVPIPGTYQPTDSNPQGLWEIIGAPIKGFADAQDIALFVLVIGGFLGIVMKTGAIDAGVAALINKFKGKETLLIPMMMFIFSLGGTSFGLAEETVAFYAFMTPVMLAAGFDTVTTMGTILFGSGLGCLNSTVNPFATGIASGFAGISIGDGIFIRGAFLIIQVAIVSAMLMRYAKRVKEDPTQSVVYETRQADLDHFLGEDLEQGKAPELTPERKGVLMMFFVTFIIMILGVIPWAYKFNITIFEDAANAVKGIPVIGKMFGGIVPLGDWWFGEMTMLFLVMSVLVGRVAKMSEKEFMSTFIAGAKDLLGVALIVGVSRGITIVMNAGGMTATVLNAGEHLLKGLGKIPFIILTYLFYIPMGLLIPSTSGLATLTMPILAPLADFSGVPKSAVVTAYQSASGIMNLITPASAVVMGGLAIVRVNYITWIKFSIKFLVAIFATTMVCLIISVM